MQLVKMIREDGKTADVHPDEVENYATGGYQVAEQPKKAPAKRKAKK